MNFDEWIKANHPKCGDHEFVYMRMAWNACKEESAKVAAKIGVGDITCEYEDGYSHACEDAAKAIREL